MIHDWVYDGRAIHYTELSKLGANISLADPHRVYIEGPTKFTAADITAPPALRPAVLVLLGMLAADGISVLRNVYTINRGYEDLAERLDSSRCSHNCFARYIKQMVRAGRVELPSPVWKTGIITVIRCPLDL